MFTGLTFEQIQSNFSGVSMALENFGILNLSAKHLENYGISARGFKLGQLIEDDK